MKKGHTTFVGHVIPVLIGLLLASSVVYALIPVKRTHAFFGGSWVLVVKEYALESAINVIGKRMIQMITADTVNWINSGFRGNPGFVTNPNRLAVDAADTAFNDFFANPNGVCYINENGQRICEALYETLCSPFRVNIQFALRSAYMRDNLPFICTIDDVVDNVQGFYQNFNNGGWQAWFALTQHPGNRPFGAYLTAQDELSRRVNNNVNVWTEQADWGNGILAWQECTDPIPIDTYEQEDPDSLELTKVTRKKTPRECPPEHLEIRTPGTVVENQLENVFGSGVRGLELADEINEIIGALLDQFTLKLFNSAKGLFGLSGKINTGTPRIIAPVSLNNVIDPRDPDVADYCGSFREGMLPTATLEIDGGATFTTNRRDVTVQPGDTVTYSWCGANANQYTSTYTVRRDLSSGSCTDSGIDVPWNAQSAFGAIDATVDGSQTGCVYEITYSARNTAFEDVLTGNTTQETASSQITVRVGDTPPPAVPGQCTISEVTESNLSAAAAELNSEIASPVIVANGALWITSSNGTVLLNPVSPSAVTESIKADVARRVGCSDTSSLTFVVFQVSDANNLPPEMLAQLGSEQPNQILVVID